MARPTAPTMDVIGSRIVRRAAVSWWDTTAMTVSWVMKLMGGTVGSKDVNRVANNGVDL